MLPRGDFGDSISAPLVPLVKCQRYVIMLIVDCADYIPAPKEIKLFGLAFSISIKRLSQDIK